MEHPKRKKNRLEHYDYCMPGAYFITVCTADRKKIFWDDVGASIARPQDVPLSPQGRIVENAIHGIHEHYAMITVDRYAIMPNHIHLLLQIHSDENGCPVPSPRISIVIQQMKGIVTKEIGVSVWQKLYHDHVIRDQRDYDKIWQYIETNPMKWADDCFYTD